MSVSGVSNGRQWSPLPSENYTSSPRACRASVRREASGSSLTGAVRSSLTEVWFTAVMRFFFNEGFFYSVSLEVNTTRHWSACEEHYECHNIIGWRHVNLCSVDTFVSMWCVSRARAPQRCSLTLSRGPLNARDLDDLPNGGCGGGKDRSVNTGSGEENMKCLSFRKWSSWIIHSEMIFLPILWFLCQTRAAPSITTEQMDMGVVCAHSSLSSD